MGTSNGEPHEYSRNIMEYSLVVIFILYSCYIFGVPRLGFPKIPLNPLRVEREESMELEGLRVKGWLGGVTTTILTVLTIL